MAIISFLLMILAPALYLLAGIAFLRRRWPIRAGLAMALVSFFPLLWQAWFTDSEAPGFAFLLMLMLPPALLVMVIGSLLWAWRKVARSTELP